MNAIQSTLDNPRSPKIRSNYQSVKIMKTKMGMEWKCFFQIVPITYIPKRSNYKGANYRGSTVGFIKITVFQLEVGICRKEQPFEILSPPPLQQQRSDSISQQEGAGENMEVEASGSMSGSASEVPSEPVKGGRKDADRRRRCLKKFSFRRFLSSPEVGVVEVSSEFGEKSNAGHAVGGCHQAQ